MDEIFRTRFDEVFMEDKEVLEAQQRRLSAAPDAARIDQCRHAGDRGPALAAGDDRRGACRGRGTIVVRPELNDCPGYRN